MNTQQVRMINLPIKGDLLWIYASSFLIVILMAVVSIVGLRYRTLIYPTDDLIRTFVSNDVVNLFVGLPILLGSMSVARQIDRVALLGGRAFLRLLQLHRLCLRNASQLGIFAPPPSDNDEWVYIHWLGCEHRWKSPTTKPQWCCAGKTRRGSISGTGSSVSRKGA